MSALERTYTGPLEKSIERALVMAIKGVGGEAIKMAPKGLKGVPDRLIVLPNGVTIWCEMKRPTGRLAAAQRVWHDRLRSMGHIVVVLWSEADVDAVIGAIADGKQHRPADPRLDLLDRLRDLRLA
jgi:hypothetical protein